MDGKDYRERVDALAETWKVWGEVGEELTSTDWSRPTRCEGWDVQAIYAHHSVFPLVLAKPLPTFHDRLGPPLSAAQVLNHFNAPDGVAHTKASEVASSASEQAATEGTGALVARFRDQGPRTVRVLIAADEDFVVPWVTAETPIAMRELVRIVLVEAVVHLLDVQRALDYRPDVNAEAMAETVRVLAEMTPAIEFVEAVTGRTPSAPFPLLR